MSQAIRFTVVAHASPRWRGARGANDADKRNQELSQQRERNVRAVVERIVRETLGADVVIQASVSQHEGTVPKGVQVGGYAVGSRDSLRATNGNRQNNDETYRKVDVMFDRFDTSSYTGMRSTGQISTKIRKWWAVRVDRLYVNYIASTWGEADLTLINGESNKSMKAKVSLKGTGYLLKITPRLNVAKMVFSLFVSAARGSIDEYREKSTTEHPFGCNREMGFADFEGQTVTFEKNTYIVGVRGHTMSMTFNNLGDDASGLMLSPLGGLGLIGFGRYAVSGQLRLAGPNPGDWIDAPPDLVTNDATKSSGFTLTLTFPTEKSRYEDISFVDRMKFEALVEGHAERFGKQLTKP